MDNAGVPEMAGRLLDFIGHVSADEFYRHDTHFNRDSRLGRELLYLIANDDWIRSTTEVINLTRGDSVESLVKVNVDTSKITHESFGENTGPLWLPLMVLTMPDRTGPVPSASPGQLTVVNQNGSVLAPMREGDVWHALSAALAEIFITLADNRWPWTDERKPGIDRDQRVLLSSAVFRMLSGTGRHIDSLVVDRGGHGHGDDARYEESDSPLGEAKRKLTILMRRYFKAYTHPAQAGSHVAADTEALLLISRAAELLYAFTRAVVVVVEVERSDAPAVLTATAPVRKLEDAPRPLHRVLQQLQPRARLEVDLLLPSGDADRQVEVVVPDDVSIDLTARRSKAATPGLDADVVVTVNPPPAEARLATLMRSVLAEQTGPVQECLAGVAFTQADTLAQVLHQHLVLSARPSDDAPLPGPNETYADLYQRTDQIRHRLSELREQLRRVAASPPDPEAAAAELRETWGDGSWLRHVMLRRASVSVPGPDTLTGRTALIENTRQRLAPSAAKVTVPVEVSDARFYSIARFSTTVSIILTLVVLAFDIFGLFRPFKEAASPEVLASTLTLFAVIQAGRVEAPDRSTMRGRLTGAGNWLIIASVLPTIVLAIAIAFVHSGWGPIWWALGAVAAQTLFLTAMWRGPLSAAGGHIQQPYRVLRTSPTPAYEKTGVLRAVWWQAATANALVLGHQAHGYLVWEHRAEGAGTGPQSVVPVLGRLQPGVEKTLALARSIGHRGAVMTENGDGDDGSDGPVANILAMMRSGTTREAVTFVVLRDPPAGFPPDAVKIPLDIDPDRLSPAESASEYLDVLVGVPGSGTFAPLREHPLSGVLRAAKHQWLQIMEIQLPVAPPTMSVREDLLWARVRIGFRDLDYGRIAHFLHEVASIRCPVWVRSWPEHIPRSLSNSGDTGTFAIYGTRRELMTAQDFDVVSVAARHGADIHSRTWRMMAICVNTAFGMEHDLLSALSAQVPGLRLAAISHAELHGMDMFLVLGQMPGGGTDAGPDTAALEKALAGEVRSPSLKVVLDEWRTAKELGFAEPGPLLRVDVRTRDIPGTLQMVLDSLNLALRKQLPSLPEGEIPDWRVSLQTGLGHTARARLTMGLPVPDEDVHDWPPSRWAEVARDARALAVRGNDGDFGVAENMVISVRPVRRKTPLPPPETAH